MSTVSTYEQQAIDFLKATDTGITTTYLDHMCYFEDDKEKGTQRDIFRVKLWNGRYRFTFRFGQSVANSGKHPTAYDILTCLTTHEPGTFENFCSEYGYDSDSRKAYKIYKAVMKEWKNIQLLFTPEQIELLKEIQ